MIEILWGLFNLFLLIGLFYFLFKHLFTIVFNATTSINKKTISYILAIVFLLVTAFLIFINISSRPTKHYTNVSINEHSPSIQTDTILIKKVITSSDDTSSQILDGTLTTVLLEETIATQTLLLIGYEKSSNQFNIFHKQTMRTGFTMGIKWMPSTVSLKYNGVDYSYKVHGTKKWRLLGITIYSQSVQYNGRVNLK